MPGISIILPVIVFIALLSLESVLPLFKDWTGRRTHIFRNIFLFVINSIIIWAVFHWIQQETLELSSSRKFGLMFLFQAPKWVYVVLLFLLFDLWMYIWHRANHEIKFLWRFHRMHHTDPQMDVSTALRFHPIELVLSSIIRLGIFLVLGMEAWILVVYELAMKPVIYLHHSNFFLPQHIDRILRQIIVTPWMHWVHHSDQQPETDSNYGTVFSWWDRLFGSFRLRNDPQNIKYGLMEYTDPNWQTMLGMIKTPFL